jgi:GDP-L-fucose synthase
MTTNKKFWKNKKVLVTGGSGFVGKHLVVELKSLEDVHVSSPKRIDGDLRDFNTCLKVCKNIDIVIHLAAKVGGIGFNREFPADLYDDNILMGVNMMKAARLRKVKKFVAIGTICSYPKFTPVPFREENLWQGYPEETNAPYGLAKLMQLVQAQAYRQQYGFNTIFLLPVNLYGPGENFDLQSSHVIPALIRKFLEAKEKGEKKVVVWGTGRVTREFLYVDDVVEGILLATEKYNKPEPVNLGAGFEISIKDLAKIIKRLIDFNGKIVLDKTKPDGQPRRMLDISHAKKEFGFVAKTPFEEGLKRTIKWYLENKH